MFLAFISSFGQLIIPVRYLITVIAQVLIAQILFFPFSLLLRTCFTLCTYLVVAAFLEAYSWFQFTCRILRYLQLSSMSAMLPYGSAVLPNSSLPSDYTSQVQMTVSLSLLAYSFLSSMQRRWVEIAPFWSRYPQPVLRPVWSCNSKQQLYQELVFCPFGVPSNFFLC